jgi:hypothetical protein
MHEIEKAENLEVVSQLSVVESQERANIDMLISTAKKYPRDITSVKRTMEAMATLDEDTAESCNYHLERNGKSIDGPSVRMAEIAVACYQNVRCGSRILSNDGKVVTGQAFCHDLENNTFIAWETQRRITDKYGRIYGEDMQVLTGNAASAIAFRNAVFKIIPGALIKPVAEKARQVAVGDLRTLTERRTRALKKFASIGVRENQLLAFLGRASTELIDIVDVEKLFGVFTAIKEGSTTIEEQFPPISAVEPVKAQVPTRGRGRPPKEEPIEVKSEQVEAKHEPPPQPQAAPQPAASAGNIVAAAHLPPPPPPPPPRTKEESPFAEPKPVKKKESPPPVAAAALFPEPVEVSAADQIRAKLTEAGLSEENLIKWLHALGTVKSETMPLETVNAKYLRMIVDDWTGIPARVKEFMERQK